MDIGKNAIEIGSSNGYLLKQMQDKGWNVLGFEPSTTLAREAEKNGVLTAQMYFGSDDSLQSIKNENYWWKYVMGADIQIVFPSWVEEHFVDSIIVFATGYADEIIGSNNDFINKGGRFVRINED